MENEYMIWAEGFRATGQSGTAILLGTAKGKTFELACLNYSKQDPEFNKYFNFDKLTYWGCKLYDNEQDAGQAFGCTII